MTREDVQINSFNPCRFLKISTLSLRHSVLNALYGIVGTTNEEKGSKKRTNVQIVNFFLSAYFYYDLALWLRHNPREASNLYRFLLKPPFLSQR